MTADSAAERLLGLLGLARRAGQLAVGETAIEKLVVRGKRPLIIIADGCGNSLRNKVLHLQPVRGFLLGAVDRHQLAKAVGRQELAVVGVADPGFVSGIEKLELPITRPDEV